MESKIPAHVALIMDGNGRWAAARGQERIWGHAHGVGSVKSCIKAAQRTGVKFLTFYTFSTENWGRPESEVAGLMEIMCDSIAREAAEMVSEGVRIRIIGSREGLSEKVLSSIDGIEKDTAGGDVVTVMLAFNYSSRSEIVRAASSGRVVDEASFERELYTAGVPDPDLLVRTGGEQRLSNFLLWQAAYAELYFTPVMWPDFGEKDFEEALAEFAQRQRRFGKVL